MSYLKHYYSSDELQRIEEEAHSMQDPISIARIIEVDFNTFRLDLKNPQSPAYTAFYKGIALLEFEVNNNFAQASNENILGAQMRLTELRRYKGRIENQLYG